MDLSCFWVGVIQLTKLGVKNIESYYDHYESLKNDPEYLLSMEKLNRQHNLSHIKSTILTVGKKLIEKCEADEYAIQALSKELETDFSDFSLIKVSK